MKNHGSFSKTTLVCQALKGEIEKGVFPNGSKLPSVRSLCTSFKASPWTILQAISELESLGIVERKPRSGVLVKSEITPRMPSPPGIEPRKPKSERIADALVKEIAAGNFRIGERLPQKKALAFRFQTSMATLDKALRLVEAREVLHRSAGTWIAGPEDPGPSEGIKSVELTGNSRCFSGFKYLAGYWQFFYAFERELNLNKISITDRLGLGYQKAAAALRVSRNSDLLGSLSVFLSADARFVCEGMKKSLRARQRRGPLSAARIAVFSISHRIHNPEVFDFPKSAHVFGFAPDGRRAGDMIGRQLAALGHKRLAFLSSTDRIWNRLRMEGLQNGIDRATLGKASVLAFTPENASGRDWGQGPFDASIYEPVMNKAISDLFDGYQMRHLTPQYRIAQDIYNTVIEDDQIMEMQPVFERAAAEKGITAWVGADPIVTLMAYDFLKKKGIRFPADVSLIGIDDNNELLVTRRISAYSFQYDRSGYLAAHAILGDIPIKRNRHSVVECPGRIVDRGSVRRMVNQ